MSPRDTSDHYPMWVALTRTHYFLRKLREKELKKMGLSMAQSTVLAIIHRSESETFDATPAEIAKRLLRAPSTTTELIDRMVEQGMVKKVQDLDRKNMVRVEMTESGRELYYRSIEVEYFEKIFSKLTVKRRQRLVSYLDTLADSAMDSIYNIKGRTANRRNPRTI